MISDIFFNITLRRRTLFYTVNLIVPTVGISYLSVLVFYLPANSNEKIALCITILLSQTMFFLLISEIMPSTSLALPLLGKYLLFTMLLVGLCVIITIVILNIHYRKPSTHKMAPWIRQMFIRRLPKLLLMRVPQQLLVDASFKHRLHTAKKSKLNSSMMASLPSSPDSLRRYQAGSCNGLNSTNSRLSGYLGILGGNGVTGAQNYNGLSSAVGLDESLSDVAVRKKYPFELEKAIHNVKFIQHHLRRQDEFNAVSNLAPLPPLGQPLGSANHNQH